MTGHVRREKGEGEGRGGEGSSACSAFQLADLPFDVVIDDVGFASDIAKTECVRIEDEPACVPRRGDHQRRHPRNAH